MTASTSVSRIEMKRSTGEAHHARRNSKSEPSRYWPKNSATRDFGSAVGTTTGEIAVALALGGDAAGGAPDEGGAESPGVS
jgi:hypothetical protein